MNIAAQNSKSAMQHTLNEASMQHTLNDPHPPPLLLFLLPAAIERLLDYQQQAHEQARSKQRGKGMVKFVC